MIYLILAIVILVIILIFSIKIAFDLKKKNNAIEEQLHRYKRNIETLQAHQYRLNEIENKMTPIAKKIKEAKTDEEVFKIIADIVALNNNKL